MITLADGSKSRLRYTFGDKLRNATPSELKELFDRGQLMQEQYRQYLFLWAAKLVGRDKKALAYENELRTVLSHIPDRCWIPVQRDFLRANGLYGSPEEMIALFRDGQVARVRFREFLRRESRKIASLAREEKRRAQKKDSAIDFRDLIPVCLIIRELGLKFWPNKRDRRFLLSNGFIEESNQHLVN